MKILKLELSTGDAYTHNHETLRVHVKHDKICTSIVSVSLRTFLMYAQRNQDKKHKLAAVDIMVRQTVPTVANVSSLQHLSFQLNIIPNQYGSASHNQVSVKTQIFCYVSTSKQLTTFRRILIPLSSEFSSLSISIRLAILDPDLEVTTVVT